MDAAPPDAQPIRLTDRYLLLGHLGHGGMAVVWRARDEVAQSDVAVKIPDLAAIGNPVFLQRFARETRRMLEVRHPHVVPLLDAGDAAGVPFVVMPFLRGGSLQDRPAHKRTAPFADAMRDVTSWLAPIAGALDTIHALGIVHRDVKPSNLLFDDVGRPHLSDLGLAKVLEGEPTLTPKGLVVGTPATIAPEAETGARPTPAYDQYGLACVVFRRLADAFPFANGLPMTVLRLKARTDAPSLAVFRRDAPPAVAAAVARALARPPQARFPSCAAFATAVLEGART